MELINGYWIDENNNSWDSRIYTKEQAQKCSESLVNCYDCEDCQDCEDCKDCQRCWICLHCWHCQKCEGCWSCYNCRKCWHCEDCKDFQDNPQRYITGRIGSRYDQTTFYWLSDRTWVECGCFSGTLEEFESEVKKVHGDNEHGQAYMAEIAKVRMLMQ